MNIFSGLRNRMRSKRGAAMVEFSILTMAFVPLILLPMYFQDSLRFQLDAQEAVAATTWDFAFNDYENNTAESVRNSIESANRARYVNLWPANKKTFEDDQRAGPWCDFRWEKQVTCSVDKEFAADAYGTLGFLSIAKKFHAKFTKGGLVSCTGNISVENHYIPEEFTQDFHSKSLFPHHEAMPLPSEDFAIMVDPWSIHDPGEPEKCGDGNDPYYERVEFVWKEPFTYVLFTMAWWIYVAKLLPKLSLTAAFWDDPTKLKLSAQHYEEGSDSYKTRSVTVSGGRKKFYTTPYGDDDPVKGFKDTFEARTANYLGCEVFGPDCK